jgi:hypothetical protein
MAAPEAPLPPVPPIAEAAAVAEAAAELTRIRHEGYFGGARLLAADAGVASLLANEARRRAMHRVFGIPLDSASGLATLIALGAVAKAVRRRTDNFQSGLSRSDALVGLGILRETAYDIAGPSSRSSRYFGTLLGVALIGGATQIAVKKSAHGVRVVSHRAFADFNHRYGHLIRPNRRRRAT